MDLLEVISTGITGVVFGALTTFVLTNMCKAGWFGALSRWLNRDQVKGKYGGRVLTVSATFATFVNLIQMAAIVGQGEYISFWMLALRVIACALLASGGYEYVKAIIRNVPKGVEDDAGEN